MQERIEDAIRAINEAVPVRAGYEANGMHQLERIIHFGDFNRIETEGAVFEAAYGINDGVWSGRLPVEVTRRITGLDAAEMVKLVAKVSTLVTTIAEVERIVTAILY